MTEAIAILKQQGAEIVDPQFDTKILQPTHGIANGAGAFEQQALGQFHNQPPRRKTAIGKNAGNGRDQGGLAQVQRR